MSEEWQRILKAQKTEVEISVRDAVSDMQRCDTDLADNLLRALSQISFLADLVTTTEKNSDLDVNEYKKTLRASKERLKTEAEKFRLNCRCELTKTK